jgi:TPR repeat protein
MSIKQVLLALSAGLVFAANIALAGSAEDAAHAYAAGDYAKAFPLLESQAKKNDPSSQFILGVMYSRGLGVTQDSAAAVDWWAKSAAKGNVEAQEMLGESYATGVGVKQDFNKALVWISKAAEAGNKNGQNVLGRMYEAGLGGLKASASDAYKWYYLAASSEGGFPAATDAIAKLEKTMPLADVAAAKAKAEKWITDHKKPAEKAAAKSKTK